MSDNFFKIYKEIKKINYLDFHFHWEKDEWYPYGSFKNIGKKIRNPLELIFQDYAGDIFLKFEEFPFKNKWEFIGFCLKNEEKAYDVVQPYIKKAMENKLFEPILLGFEHLYNMPDIKIWKKNEYMELSKKVKEAYQNGILRWLPVAYEKGNIFRCINIWTTRYAREYFDNLREKEKEKELNLIPPTFRFDYFLVLPFRYKKSLDVAKWFWEAIQDINGLPITILKNPWQDSFLYKEKIEEYLMSTTFDDYLKYIDKIFTFFYRRGVNYLKSASCYKRTLLFEERTEKEARKSFETLKREYIGNNEPEENFEEIIRIFEDYIFFRCLEMAKEFGWDTVQIHTGHKNRNIESGRPILLENIISKNPDINFILLHGGKFFYKDVIYLCEKYNNVIADFTWIPIIEPELAKKMVKEFLEKFPYRTIAGLDMANIEGCVGMSEINKKLISEILTELQGEGKINSLDECIKIGESVIYKKAKQLFSKCFQFIFHE